MKSRTDFLYNDDWVEYLRQYYAGLAMQGLMSRQINPYNSGYVPSDDIILSSVAVYAVKISDALIKELNK